MGEKEFKIGESFQYGTAKLICVKADDSHYSRCHGCLFDGYECQIVEMYLGECASYKRSDKTNVIFKEVEE